MTEARFEELAAIAHRAQFTRSLVARQAGQAMEELLQQVMRLEKLLAHEDADNTCVCPTCDSLEHVQAVFWCGCCEDWFDEDKKK